MTDHVSSNNSVWISYKAASATKNAKPLLGRNSSKLPILKGVILSKKSGKIVGFLGTGPKETGYTVTSYRFEQKVSKPTRFFTLALAELLDIERITIFTTKASRERYQEEFDAEARSRNIEIKFEDFALGTNQEGLDSQLAQLAPELMDPRAVPLVLDITHGFRSFPFFASSMLAFASAVSEAPSSFRVVYAAFEATKDEICPVWDLSHTLKVYHEGFELATFLRSGRLGPALPDQLESLARGLKTNESGASPNFEKLSKALRTFADDFATIRVGSLLLGSSKREVGSAVNLRNALWEQKSAVAEHLPMLSQIFGELETMLAPITHDYAIPHLATHQGLQCSLDLAKLYYKCERYSECAVVLREMASDLHSEPTGAMPGYAEYSDIERRRAEHQLRKRDGKLLKRIGAVRNDIEHGGYDQASHMKKPSEIREKLQGLLNEMEGKVARRGA